MIFTALCIALILFFSHTFAYYSGVVSAEDKQERKRKDAREAQDLLETDFTLNTRGLPGNCRTNDP